MTDSWSVQDYVRSRARNIPVPDLLLVSSFRHQNSRLERRFHKEEIR